jgi:hypothetical protein
LSRILLILFSSSSLKGSSPESVIGFIIAPRAAASLSKEYFIFLYSFIFSLIFSATENAYSLGIS